MKIFILLFIITNILSSQTINEQIHALEKASPKERVQLMNNIKREQQTIGVNLGYYW